VVAIVDVRYFEDRIFKSIFLGCINVISNFFVLILKRVQHRYKETTLRSPSTGLSTGFDELRTTGSGHGCPGIGRTILLSHPLEKEEIKGIQLFLRACHEF
jgi:hypothetical protein